MARKGLPVRPARKCTPVPVETANGISYLQLNRPFGSVGYEGYKDWLKKPMFEADQKPKLKTKRTKKFCALIRISQQLPMKLPVIHRRR
jgi:hypothetical protein